MCCSWIVVVGYWRLELCKSDHKPATMVRLTVDMLLRCSSSHAKRQRDESRKHFLRRLTHLHLENREIDDTVSQGFLIRRDFPEGVGES